MTAAKVMDIISRLPRGTSSVRSICLYQGKNGNFIENVWKIPNRNVQTFGFVYHDTNGLNHGLVWKIQSFLLCEIFEKIWSSFGSTVMEKQNNLRKKAIWENPMWTITEPCLNHEFPRGELKTTILGKSSYFFMVIWHGRSCQEMCGTILWIGKPDDSTTLQSINSMHWWPSLQRRRIEIRGRIVKSFLSNCSEMLVLGTYWNTSYSLVSE